MYNGRLDDKGRVKVASAFQQYFASLPEKKLFVTSLDRLTAQIYPISVWRSNESFFQDYREDPDLAGNVAFNANELGAETEMDAQGRVLFPPELRRALALENQTLHLYAHRGRIEVLSDKEFEERRRKASQTPRADVTTLERAGLR
jgi:MraZ protein